MGKWIISQEMFVKLTKMMRKMPVRQVSIKSGCPESTLHLLKQGRVDYRLLPTDAEIEWRDTHGKTGKNGHNACASNDYYKINKLLSKLHRTA